VKATDFQVMGVMSARNLEIRMSDQILRAQKVRQGTQITVGMGGDQVGPLASGGVIGALYLMNNAQFEAVRKELEAAPEPATIEERDGLLALLREAVETGMSEGPSWPWQIDWTERARAAIAKAEGR
jgi:hypothetical protein